MNEIVKGIEVEMRLCFPDLWAGMTATARAKSVARQFSHSVDDISRGIKIRQTKAKERREAAAAAAAARRARKEREFKKWHEIILKAHGFYADMIYEYAIAENGDEGGEALSSGAWTPKRYMKDECMREALFVAHGIRAIDDPKFYDRAIKFWRKNW